MVNSLRSIPLREGRVGTWANGAENNAVVLTYDMTSVLSIWPDAVPSVAYERADGKKYAHACERDGAVLKIPLTLADTAVPGLCKAVVTMTNADGKANSTVYYGTVSQGIDTLGDTPDDVQQGIIEQVNEAVARAEAAAERAESAGGGGAGGGSGGTVEVDSTLTQEGMAADAKAVGDRIGELSEEMDNCVKTVNGAVPDANGNVVVAGDGSGVSVDTSLTQAGAAADAKATGDKINELSGEVKELKESGVASDDAIPDYWAEYLPEKIRRVQTLQRNGGKDSYSFVVLTDFHHSEKLNHYSPKLIKKIMDDCGIKFCLCLGDTQNGGSWDTKELELADWAGIDELFRPIYDRTLMTQGNHDGAYGKADMNGDGKIEGATDYYIYNLTPGEVYDLMFRKVGLINGVTFDAEKNGYYVDDPISKVRYILVNTHYSDGAVNEDGTAVNNVMRITRIGQSQMNMVIEALQSMPSNGWHAVIGSHIPLAHIYDSGGGADLALLCGMLEAFQSKTAYANTYGTVGNYDYVSVNVDFAQAKGSVLAAFGGHVHYDGQNTDYSFPVITSASDNTDSVVVSNGDGYTVVSGEQGTITEQSFDVFTVDRQAGSIHATKIGFGENRMFAIGDAYSVTLNLDGAKVSNIATVVRKGAAYHNLITPYSGNLLNTVVVTMGGVDVTADVYANGNISIESVTGDIIITVTTTYAFTNLADINSPDWRVEEGYLGNSGEFIAVTSPTYNKALLVTNYIPVTKGDILRIKGFDRESLVGGTMPRLVFYDENKTYVNNMRTNNQYAGKADGLTSATAAAYDETGILTFEVLVRGDSGAQHTYNNYCDRAKYVRLSTHYLTTPEDVIITVNEEIS